MTAEGSFPNPIPNPRLASNPSKNVLSPHPRVCRPGQHPANPRVLNRKEKPAWKPLWKGAKEQSQGVWVRMAASPSELDGAGAAPTLSHPAAAFPALVLNQLKENTCGQQKQRWKAVSAEGGNCWELLGGRGRLLGLSPRSCAWAG